MPSDDLGLPLIEATEGFDINLRKDFNMIIEKLEEYKSKSLLINKGKEVFFAVMCRKTPNDKLRQNAVDYYEGKYKDKPMHCYKMKI